MASKVLYPPIIDSYMPAFPASNGECKIYFSLSKYNSAIDFKSIHVSIIKQRNNANAINYADSDGKYRHTGIIVNMPYQKEESNDSKLYSFILKNEDLAEGFVKGEIYKIQIRLSESYYGEQYGGASPEALTNQLNNNSFSFSEQSTVCVLKAIGDSQISISPFNYTKSEATKVDEEERITTITYSTLDISGKYKNTDDSEILYYYNIKLYDQYDLLEENSGDLYTNEFKSLNEFKYIFKKELEDKQEYKIVFSFTTNNFYNEIITLRFKVELDESIVDDIARICAVDNVNTTPSPFENESTSVLKEQEEGRIGLKIQDSRAEAEPVFSNICIRRSSSKDDFAIQEDIKIFPVEGKKLSEIDIIQDLTIESGVYYKYGVQMIDTDGNRSPLAINNKPIMRDFEYSFLLGENNQQLKLKFNNIMSSYKVQVMEGKIEPLGGFFPVISRNGALKYRIFPIAGLISFQMDDNNLFCSKEDLFGNNIDLYNKVRTFSGTAEHSHKSPTLNDSPSYSTERIGPSYETDSQQYQDSYDYIYEREFREAVLKFLYDGKPKLFKSPTEGNIIVRLTEINCTPNKTLDRMIYEFTSNGNEIAEATLENYIKYNFLNIGEIKRELVDRKIKIGQLQSDFIMGDNILYHIYKKYKYIAEGKDITPGQEIFERKIKKIYNIRITINDKPLRIGYGKIGNDGKPQTYLLGNELSVKGEKILVLAPQRVYNFDPSIVFEDNDFVNNENGIQFINSDKDTITPERIYDNTVNATIDFLYEIEISEQKNNKKIAVNNFCTGMGQLFNSYKAGTSLFNEIYYKYYYESDSNFRRLQKLSSIEIESKPGLVFRIIDSEDSDYEDHEINDTGILNIYDIVDFQTPENKKNIIFFGVRNKKTGEIDKENIKEDIVLNYWYRLRYGEYDKTEL